MATHHRHTFVGIDPGANGGVAIITTNGATAWKMTDRMTLFISLRELYATQYGKVTLYVERVGGFMRGPGGSEGQFNMASGHSMFSFGFNFGTILMAAEIAGFVENQTYFLKVPHSWQRSLGITRHRGEPKGAYKNRLKALAQKLFPKVKVTLATADALLIAECARRQHKRA